MFFTHKKLELPTSDQALPGRDIAMPVAAAHTVTGNSLTPPLPDGYQQALFGLGCFWGAERRFWQQTGVWTTAVGYAAGLTPNPTYEEVCSGMTGHNEVVWLAIIPNRSATNNYSKSFGNHTIQPKGCVKVMIAARNIAQVFIAMTRHNKAQQKRVATVINRY